MSTTDLDPPAWVNIDAYEALRSEAKRLRRCNDTARALVDAALVALRSASPGRRSDVLLDIRLALSDGR